MPSRYSLVAKSPANFKCLAKTAEPHNFFSKTATQSGWTQKNGERCMFYKPIGFIREKALNRAIIRSGR